MLLNAFLLALREIRRNIMRSSLTSLGIIIGVAAVITMVTLGSGATEKVKTQIGSLGSNLLQIRPGQGFHGPGGIREAATPFDVKDANAIKREILGIEAVAPTAEAATQAIYGNRNWSTMVTGSTNGFMEVRDWPVEKGRQFRDGELRGGTAVCILGSTVSRELFGDDEPLGEIVRLKKLAFRVIGVFRAKGQSTFGRDQDDFILIPLRTFQRRIAGNTDVTSLYVSVRDGYSINRAKQDMERLMRERRHISEGKEEDFHVRDMREIANVLSGTTKVLTSLLGAVAAVSLLVGGIGIMNIMLVSVTERTREIGTRLAIGALEREVLLQFLVEAVVLSSLGGVIGIILALGMSAWLAGILLVPFVFNPDIVVLAFAFSVAVGITFGYFPARKAARLDPIEALRHE
ncbi:MAG: ABC transporter permease [Deltaproteobacteria bacterium]|nr:MAG: multidrug ABC transporter substrate-binding protein [Desulfobacteraceae bacterium 4484_190.3]RLB13735.1 MAG: ABC transporter permease [Deltaproteobacteria bacterium]